MVQPRKEQVKNLKTRHSKVTYYPLSGDSYTDILDVDIYPQVISDTPGGVQQDIRAIAISTLSEPYNTILAGDSIFIKVDDPNPVMVVFAATDTTASRIAAAINIAFGSNVALNDEGTLILFSLQQGDDAYIEISNITAGTLSKLGLTAGIYNGITAPNRGIVTKEIAIESIGGSDFIIQGGFVSLRSGDGRIVTTDATSSSIITSGSVIIRRLDTPGGMPIHGRIIRNPANTGYRILYYAQMPTEAIVRTFNSDFSSLDGTDDFTMIAEIKYKQSALDYTTVVNLAVTFPAGLYNRDLVLTRINQLFADQVAAGDGNAFITGVIGQPFVLNATNDQFSIAVDGGIPQVVTFPSQPIFTTQEVVDRINILVVGVTASVEVVTGDNKLVKIQSNEGDGTTSSLDIQNSGSVNTLRKLGITPGLYRGVFIAEAYGAEEIIFKGLSRGGSSKLSINGDSTTLVRMGLIAGVYYGKNGGETKIDFPTLDVIANTDSFSFLLVPEIVEYGETDLKVESTLQQFDSNFGISSGGKGSDSVIDGDYTGFSRGIPDAGKPVFTNFHGQIDTLLTRAVQDDLQRTLKKFIIGDFTPGINSVTKLSIPAIQTPGVDGNPGATSASFTIDIDPNQAHAVPYLQIRFWRDGSGAAIPFLLQYDGADAYTNVDWYMHLGPDTGISAETILRFIDANTNAAGIATGGIEDLPLSDDAGGKYLRVLEVLSNALTQPSLIGKINAAAWTVTVGDGISSFGDFTGTDAIQQAISYFVANKPSDMTGMHVLVKAGSYIFTSPCSLPNGQDIIIEGTDQRSCKLQNASVTAADTIFNVVSTNTILPTKLTLKQLTLERMTVFQGNYAIISDSSIIRVDNCYFNSIAIKFIESLNFVTNTQHACIMRGCNIVLPLNVPVLHIQIANAERGGYTFEDCRLEASSHYPILRIEDTGATTDTLIKDIIFSKCQIHLSGTTNNSGNLTGNSGVLELIPTTTGWLTVESVLWRDCHVKAVTGLNHILMYLRASNGVNYIKVEDISIIGGKWDCGVQTGGNFSPFYIGDGVAKFDDTSDYVKNVTIKDVVMGFTGAASSGYGGPTAELAWPIGLNNWVAFYIAAYGKISIRDWIIPTASARSGSGDVMLQAPTNYNVRGIKIDNWIDTTNFGTPNQRMHFTGRVFSGGSINNIHIDISGISNPVATNGIIRLAPFGQLIINNCTILSHIDALTRGAFFLDGSLNASLNKGLVLNGCKAYDINGNGFDLTRTDPSNYIIEDLQILNCRFQKCLRGINLSAGTGATGTQVKNLIITNNICRESSSYGIYYALIWTDHSHNAVISNNTVVNNSGGPTGVQIRIGQSGGAPGDGHYGVYARATIIGNMCGGSSGSNKGCISYTRDILVPVDFPDLIMGIETGYDISGGGSIEISEREWTADGLCLYNFAKLKFV